MDTNGGFLISQIKQVQGRVFERLLNEAGIAEFNGAQGRLLYVLWQEEDLPIVEISRRTGLAKNTLTSMLDRMEAQGFVQRANDPADRRQIRIRLTQRARSLQAQYDAVSQKMNALFYRGFSSAEILDFEEKLRLILANCMEEEKK